MSRDILVCVKTGSQAKIVQVMETMGDPAGFPHCPVERHCRQGPMNA